MAEMRLYRGDYEAVRKFDLKKTSKYGLAGQGIYLTNNPNVAQTYRIKGSNESNAVLLVSGYFQNKGDVITAAFEQFLLLEWEKAGKGKYPDKTDARYKKHRISLLARWDQLVEEGAVSIDVSAPSSRPGVYGDRPQVLKTTHRRFTVTLLKTNKVGRITEFIFPNDRKEFENRILHIDKPIYESTIWENFWEHGLFQKEQKYSRAEFLEKFKNCRIGQSNLFPFRVTNYISVDYNDLIKPLKELGFIGFEYYGGQNTCSEHHRAFSLWDDEFVNAHKVKAYR